MRHFAVVFVVDWCDFKFFLFSPFFCVFADVGICGKLLPGQIYLYDGARTTAEERTVLRILMHRLCHRAEEFEKQGESQSYLSSAHFNFYAIFALSFYFHFSHLI